MTSCSTSPSKWWTTISPPRLLSIKSRRSISPTTCRFRALIPTPSADAKAPKDDVRMDEAINIMSDYTKMLHDSGSKLVQTNSSAK